MFDNTMKQRSILKYSLLIIFAATVFHPATAFSQEPQTRGPGLQAGIFGDFDTDQDGVISREEFDRGVDTLFTELDQDGDSTLSKDELPRFRGPRHGYRHGMRRHPGKGPMAGMLVARAADADDDGEVASEEWQTFLDSLEVDADGAISEDSLRAMLPRPPGMRQAPGDRRGPGSGHLSRMLDRDGDSVLDIDDLNAAFTELDQDGDGALQAEELPHFRGHRGPPAH